MKASATEPRSIKILLTVFISGTNFPHCSSRSVSGSEPMELSLNKKKYQLKLQFFSHQHNAVLHPRVKNGIDPRPTLNKMIKLIVLQTIPHRITENTYRRGT